jgi:shikimate kinase
MHRLRRFSSSVAPLRRVCFSKREQQQQQQRAGGRNNNNKNNNHVFVVRSSSAASSSSSSSSSSFATETNDLPIGAKKNIAIIGGRGCGKSSICRRLFAHDKRFKLMSLDDLIVYEESMSIPEIVSAHSWEYFRDVEYKCCVKAANAFSEFTLIDCGGGICVDLDENGEEIYSERKINALKETAMIVFIKRDVDYLASKIAGDANRPSLSATNSFKEIMERRGPWYERAADLILDGSLESGGGDSSNDNSSTNANNETALVKKKKIGKEILRYFYAKAGVEPLEEAGFYEIGGPGSVESLKKMEKNRWLSEEDEIRM